MARMGMGKKGGEGDGRWSSLMEKFSLKNLGMAALCMAGVFSVGFCPEVGVLPGADGSAGAVSAELLSAPTVEGERPAAGRVMGAEQPNIVFIMADDLGYGDLGCYGQEVIRTPNLDRMAGEGLLFTSAYAGSTVCAPSRSALMTGLHTGHTRIRGNARVALRPEDTTVAEVLRDAGYRTGLIGKWGLGEDGSTGTPNRKGFDYFYGYLNQRRAHNYYPEFLWRNTEKIFLDNKEGLLKITSRRQVDYSHDLLTAEALDFIGAGGESGAEGEDGARKGEEEGQPFFLYLAYTIPHANSNARDGMEIPAYGVYADEDWPNPQKGHAAMITRLDRDVGLIMQELEKAGIEEQTLVIFTSDNGPHKEGGADPAFFNSCGPLTGYKRSLNEGGIRVPAMAWWPGTIEEGRVSDLSWAFWDVMPTFAELAGVEAPTGGDGISIVPELRGLTAQQERHRCLYWEFHNEIWSSSQAVRMDRWKGIRRKPGAALELYDLEEDLSEKCDVAGEYPEVVAEIEAYMDGARTESEVWPMGKFNLFRFLISQLYD